MGWLEDLQEYVDQYGTAPTLAAMPRLTLRDKGIEGPTGAHRIEEIHAPLNFDYITLTTGTTAFQNIVGVTAVEIDDRVAASAKALALCGLAAGDEVLVTYPPLVNVFPRQALEQYGVRWSFLQASSRDALLLAACERRPKAIFGESSFLRLTLDSARYMGLLDKLPKGLILIAAGTPLDMALLPAAASIGAAVHDLYGCQEFGWLALDGVPLRDDIKLLPTPCDGQFDLIVGGLPTGDRFPALDTGHCCNRAGKIITYARVRSSPDLEVTVLNTTANSLETVARLARTILRIKAKIVRVAPNCMAGASQTILSIAPYGEEHAEIVAGPRDTRMFDTLLEAQMQYQAMAKTDPAWNKKR